MYTIHVDPARTLGTIKPMHGVGGGPRSGNFVYDATPDFAEAGIPYCRTHDIEYPFGAGEFVDIHCLFKDFTRDENDPSAYNFTLTDEYFKGILAAGAKPFVRLGATIEHQPVKIHVNPPADFAKWGRICSRVIDHYNGGWADGFHMGIEYWEIWNEPDSMELCWTGTFDQLVDFYDTAATVIKTAHPEVKVGGMAWANPCSPMALKWLDAVQARRSPLDFFSWHCYTTDPKVVARRAQYVEDMLKSHGFSKAESIFNEWNYAVFNDRINECYRLHKKPFECAFMAAVMSTAQDTTIDAAMYYDVQMCMSYVWNGAFSPSAAEWSEGGIRPKRRPGYYALKSWNELKKLGTQVHAQSDCPDLYVTAAKGEGGGLALLVSYFNDDAGFNARPPEEAEFVLDLPGAGPLTAFIVDDERIFEAVPVKDGRLRLAGNSCALICTAPGPAAGCGGSK